MTGAIFCETLPAIIIRSDCRGEPRKTSDPKRAISKREALADIISIARQARPKLIGQMDDLRAQFTTLSSLAKIRPSKPDDSFVAFSPWVIKFSLYRRLGSPPESRNAWRRQGIIPLLSSARLAMALVNRARR